MQPRIPLRTILATRLDRGDIFRINNKPESRVTKNSFCAFRVVRG